MGNMDDVIVLGFVELVVESHPGFWPSVGTLAWTRVQCKPGLQTVAVVSL